MDIIIQPPGILLWKDHKIRCSLGPAGIGSKQGEGDGITPLGNFPMRQVFYRPDRLARPETVLPTHHLSPAHGWCDDPADAAYNQQVMLPYSASHEILWREDHLYDIVVELGFNDDPVIPGLGSAIFFHICRDDYSPTEGCIAVPKSEMLHILQSCTPKTRVIVVPS